MIAMVAAVVFGLLVASAAVLTTCYRKVGPNRVLIVSGRPATYHDRESGESVRKSFSIYHGGGTLVIPLRERLDVMSVELMTLEIRTPEFFTKFGVPIVVDGIAQIKVRSDDPIAVATAAEMFLSKTPQEMNEIAHQMMQGHLRAVISTLPFEEIHANPEAFAQTVQRLTAADLAHMGIEVVSFTIREVQDPSGYLQALGRPQLAEVQKNAVLGEAFAERDATLGRAAAEREAKVSASAAHREAELARLEAEQKIADKSSEKERHLHELSSQVSDAKAVSDVAYDLGLARSQQQLLAEQIALRDLSIQISEKQLIETVDKPTEAERRRLLTLAEAHRGEQRILAETEAEAQRLRGLAEAEVIRARGEAEAHAVHERALAEAAGLKAKLEAEADGMKQRAQAWQSYNSAALAELLITRLPEMAAAVAAPLSKIDRIVLVNSGSAGEASNTGVERITRGVGDVLTQMPALLETLSGLDLKGLVKDAMRPESDTPPEPVLLNEGHDGTEASDTPQATQADPHPQNGASPLHHVDA